MKTVRILGTAGNLPELPETPKGTEVWCCNSPDSYKRFTNLPCSDYTRWFNLHSRAYIEATYPSGFKWLQNQDGSRPFYTLKFWPDIPGCVEFPRQQIQETFAINKVPNRYFTCSVTWLIAFAILEGFERIELWGFRLRDKPNRGHNCYKFERPCFAYWVDQARKRGIEIFYQQEIEELYSAGMMIPGDPNCYLGSLYGYETKPEAY